MQSRWISDLGNDVGIYSSNSETWAIEGNQKPSSHQVLSSEVLVCHAEAPKSPGSESGFGSSGFTGCDDSRSSSLPDSAKITGVMTPRRHGHCCVCASSIARARINPSQETALRIQQPTSQSTVHFTEYKETPLMTDRCFIVQKRGR